MTLSAKDVRVAKVVTVEPDEPLREVAKTVVKNRIHRVLVAQHCRLLGVISSLDLVDLIAGGRDRREGRSQRRRTVEVEDRKVAQGLARTRLATTTRSNSERSK